MTVLTAAWASTSDAYGWQYTFQGGRYDSVTGMIRYGLRDYRPNLGTWTEPDPAGALYINGTNLRELELDDPTTGLDPTGLKIDDRDRPPRGGISGNPPDSDINGRPYPPSDPHYVAPPQSESSIIQAINAFFVAMGLGGGYPEGGWVDPNDARSIDAIVDAATSAKYKALEFASRIRRKIQADCPEVDTDDVAQAAAHMSWQAWLTMQHGADGSALAGDLHEFHTSDPPDTARDQANNAVGREIGKTATSWEDIQQKVEAAIRAGKGFKIGPDGKPIPLRPCGCPKSK
jgi:RHS repeat-associated protein